MAALAEVVQEAGDRPLTLVAQAHHLRAALRNHLETLQIPVEVYPDRSLGSGRHFRPGQPAPRRAGCRGALPPFRVGDDQRSGRPISCPGCSDGSPGHCARPQSWSDARQPPGLSGDVRAWHRLQHPALQAVLDILPDEGGLTMVVLEMLHGPTLKDYCRQAGRDGRLEFDEVGTWAARCWTRWSICTRAAWRTANCGPNQSTGTGGRKSPSPGCRPCTCAARALCGSARRPITRQSASPGARRAQPPISLRWG